jgi:hypothetical protein
MRHCSCSQSSQVARTTSPCSCQGDLASGPCQACVPCDCEAEQCILCIPSASCNWCLSTVSLSLCLFTQCGGFRFGHGGLCGFGSFILTVSQCALCGVCLPLGLWADCDEGFFCYKRHWERPCTLSQAMWVTTLAFLEVIAVPPRGLPVCSPTFFLFLCP